MLNAIIAIEIFRCIRNSMLKNDRKMLASSKLSTEPSQYTQSDLDNLIEKSLKY